MADEMNVVSAIVEEGSELLAENGDKVIEPVKEAGHKVAKTVFVAVGSFLAGVGVTTLWNNHKEYEGMSKDEKKAAKQAKKDAKKAEREQRIADFKAKYEEKKAAEDVEFFEDEDETTEE